MNENHRRSARAPEEIKTDAGARLIARPLRPVRVVVARVAPRPPQPANVMLRCNKRSVAMGGEGTPVLVDFGLAKALVFESGGNGDPAPAPTAAAAATAAPRPLFRMTPRTGSQRYMAPEVGGGASTARARHSTPKHIHPTPLPPLR